jgi:hypothetical protein
MNFLPETAHVAGITRQGVSGGAIGGRAPNRAADHTGGEGGGLVGGAYGGGIVLGLDQIAIGGLNGTAIPDDRLIGEAKTHEPVAFDAAHGDSQGIGDLVGDVNAAGEGGAIAVITGPHHACHHLAAECEVLKINIGSGSRAWQC